MERKLFPSQEENEAILLVLREHWLHLLLKILVVAFFTALLLIFNRYAAANLPGLFLGTAGQALALLEEIYSLLILLTLFLITVFYYLNIGIITNIRVVDVSQEGVFSHTISELHIDKIEDATSKSDGFFGTLFNYGNVYVQTAGSLERFVFHNVPNPGRVEKTILDLYEKNSNFAKDTVLNTDIVQNTESKKL